MDEIRKAESYKHARWWTSPAQTLRFDRSKSRVSSLAELVPSLRFALTELRTVLSVRWPRTVSARQLRCPNLRDSRRRSTIPPRRQAGLRTTGVLSLLVLFSGLGQAVGEREVVVEVGRFSRAAPGSEFPDNWKPLTFKKIPRHTQYSLVREGEAVVVKAVSESSSSGLVREIKINPRDYPLVQWRWKVTNVLHKGDVTRKEGDDYPARLYITFEYDASKVGLLEKAQYETARLLYGQYPPMGAINYIWASKEPIGMIAANPYTEGAKMIVIETGTSKVNSWVTEERNVLEDYRRAFGNEASKEVPMISGVAIMTDTDNTKESAMAYYGDILFKKPALHP
jgi:hypothetical protein